VNAYKFLAAGAVGPFSGFRWPTGTPGPWVEGEPHPCASGVHGCLVGHLPYWLHEELWEVELDGALPAGRKLVAPRGRLLRRIEQWDAGCARSYADACAETASALAGDSPKVAVYANDAAVRAGMGHFAASALITARIAELVDGEAGYESERARQARWLADRLGLEPAP
jgi:hypothetical protein